MASLGVNCRSPSDASREVGGGGGVGGRRQDE